jgi:hypothetical protein
MWLQIMVTRETTSLQAETTALIAKASKADLPILGSAINDHSSSTWWLLFQIAWKLIA